MHAITEILEYEASAMYEVADDDELCVYRGRVFAAQRPEDIEDDYLMNVRPRSAKDRRKGCWHRLKESG